MPRAHSHYENLKVARNAPTEVIRAAYRVLAQRHHPDVNASADSARVMKILNEAWDVLSDPKKRAEHDRWIAEQESTERAAEAPAEPRPDFSGSKTYTYTYTAPPAPKPETPKRPTPRDPSPSSTSDSFHESNWTKTPKKESQQRRSSWFSNPDVKRGALGVALLAGLFSLSLDRTPDRGHQYELPAPSRPRPTPASSQPEPVAQTAQPQTKGFVPFSGELDRPASRPRSKATQPISADAFLDDPQPIAPQAARAARKPSTSPALDQDQQTSTGYVPDAPRLAQDGLSEFTVDNTSGSGDAIARLYLNGTKPAVRTFFVRHRERFTAMSLSPGSYILRYRYMGSETTYEADRPFQLRQEETASGTRYSQVRVTLYAVADGNLRTKVVPKESF